MRRVVVTGLGVVSPLADGVNLTWEKLISGKSGIRQINHFDVSDMPAKIAGIVPRCDHQEPVQGLFNPDFYMSPKEQRKVDDFILYAVAAADQAIADSGWMPQNDHDREVTGVMIGAGIGGLQEIDRISMILKESGPRRVTPFFIPASLINLAAGHVSIKHGFKGPNHAVVTACATGAHAIGDAARLIMFGDADVMVAGGTEAAVCRIGLAGFCAARALSTNYSDNPELASRPWDQGRDGFVMDKKKKKKKKKK